MMSLEIINLKLLIIHFDFDSFIKLTIKMLYFFIWITFQLGKIADITTYLSNKIGL